jgi:glycosyltransferase involved in cell wall biosynthesis
MKILLAAASFHSHISGLQRHALNVARCLLQPPEVSALHVVVAPWQHDLVKSAGLDSESRLTTHIAEPMTKSSFSRNLWYYRRLPVLAARLEADLVHLTFPMPVNAAAFSCPTVVTLHDLYPYEIPTNFGFPKSIVNRLTLKQCLRSVDAIACVSETTRLRLKQYASPAAWRKSVRIYNCVESGPPAATESPIPGWLGEPFLLCVAQHRRNKNISLLIRTVDRLLRSGEIDLNMWLVVVGVAGPETRDIHRLVADRGLGHGIHFLEGLSEPALLWCYTRCEALVAPSTTEGFGLPVTEGLLAGCRIVCSDIPAHREVANSQCRFVSLLETPEKTLATAIAAVLREPKKQPVSLPQFSAPVLAKQYMGLYGRLIASATPARSARMPGSIEISASESQSL